MNIGKIVNSSSHIDYVCQVYGPGEVEQAPRPEDHGFGTFVGIERDGGDYLVGVIANTTLLNPEFGNLGPRLSPEDDLGIFSPDYLNEKVTLVAVVALGAVNGATIQQGVPPVAAGIDARVRMLTREETVAFHCDGAGLRLAYLPMLATMRNPLAPHLTLQIIEQLGGLFPHESRRLAILGGNLAWRARVEPVG
jgi:hypothetical protein